ncbi:hypothetical protein V1512DRAFT_241410 [Lipomyces arxii]|uniref:uncharacterized protein n=1 Tax=Lipomyces arxii TaxID=56418 RepID=UPI0034CD762D
MDAGEQSATDEDKIHVHSSPTSVRTVPFQSSSSVTSVPDDVSMASKESSHSSNSSNKFNISVLCPSCNSSIALDLPMFLLSNAYDTFKPESGRDVGSEEDSEEEESSSSDYQPRTESESDSAGERGLDYGEYKKMQRRRRVEHRRRRTKGRKQTIKDLQLKVGKLSSQAASSAGRAHELQGQLERIHRKSSMLRLSSQPHSAPLSMPAPPRMSKAVPSPIITTPVRHVSASAVESQLSHSRSMTSIQQLQQQQQVQLAQQDQQHSSGKLMGLLSLARAVPNYIPFGSALMATSQFLPLGYIGSNSASVKSNSSTVANTLADLATSSSSSTSSTTSSRTASTSISSVSSASGHTDQVVNDLQLSFEKERKLREAAEEQNKQYTVEIEELSQSLFEEANNMVAIERRARLKAEHLMQESSAREEKLKQRLAALEIAFNAQRAP